MAESIPLVLKLQQGLLEEGSSVANLLRVAKVVATKLNLSEALVWIDRELEGCMNLAVADLPKYRVLSGIPRAWNPYHGWQPIIFQNAEHAKKFSKAPIGMSLPAIEESLKGSDDGYFSFPYPPEIETMLRKAISFQTQLEIRLSYEQVWSVVDSVRNLLLNWTLELEGAGVVGSEMQFTASEKKAAGNVTQNYFIQNAGVVGNVTDDAQVQNQQNASMNVGDVGAFIGEAESAAALLPDEIRERVSALLNELKREVAANQPKQGKIRELLQSVRKVCEAAAGNVAAQGIMSLIGALI